MLRLLPQLTIIFVEGDEPMQKIVSDFIVKHNLQTSGEIRYIDLVSEIGELGKEIIKGTDYGKNDFSKTVKTSDEIGDCLFSLLALCVSFNIDAQEALDNSLSKYEKRFSAKGDISSDS